MGGREQGRGPPVGDLGAHGRSGGHRGQIPTVVTLIVTRVLNQVCFLLGPVLLPGPRPLGS